MPAADFPVNYNILMIMHLYFTMEFMGKDTDSGAVNISLEEQNSNYWLRSDSCRLYA